MDYQVDKAEVLDMVDRLRRRGEYDDMASDASERLADSIGQRLRVDAEFGDADIDQLIATLTTDVDIVADREAKSDVERVLARQRDRLQRP